MKQTLFEAVGGLLTLQRVHTKFYDKVYTDEWLQQFFIGHSQVAIEKRQTTFMAGRMGGPDKYTGKQPKMAHRTIYITEELIAARQALLQETLIEFGLPRDLIQRWMKIDAAFSRQIVKGSIESFSKTTWKDEKPTIIPRPDGYQIKHH